MISMVFRPSLGTHRDCCLTSSVPLNVVVEGCSFPIHTYVTCSTRAACRYKRWCVPDNMWFNSDKGMATSFRSRSSPFTRRRGAEFLGGMSGRAGIPNGRKPYPSGKTVSYPRSVSSISTTIKFLPCTHITSADLFPPWRFSLSRLPST